MRQSHSWAVLQNCSRLPQPQVPQPQVTPTLKSPLPVGVGSQRPRRLWPPGTGGHIEGLGLQGQRESCRQPSLSAGHDRNGRGGTTPLNSKLEHADITMLPTCPRNHDTLWGGARAWAPCLCLPTPCLHTPRAGRRLVTVAALRRRHLRSTSHQSVFPTT